MRRVVVGQERGRAQGEGVCVLLGNRASGDVGVEVCVRQAASFAFPALAGHLAVARLDPIFLHGQGSVHLGTTHLNNS